MFCINSAQNAKTIFEILKKSNTYSVRGQVGTVQIFSKALLSLENLEWGAPGRICITIDRKCKK